MTESAQHLDPADAPVRPSLTISDAAAATGTSRSTVRRRLDAGDLPAAWREDGPDGPKSGQWRIPVTDLLVAGFRLNAPSTGAGADESPSGERTAGPSDGQQVEQLRADLSAARVEAERWRAVADERAASLVRADLALRAITAALPAGPQPSDEPSVDNAPSTGGPSATRNGAAGEGGRSWWQRLVGQPR